MKGGSLQAKAAGQSHFIATPLPVITALFLLNAIHAMLLGLIAEDLARTHNENQEKRSYIVLKVLNAQS